MRYTVSHGGERLDRIARKMLQSEREGAVEAILDANPGLAALALDGVVPAGAAVIVPEGFTAPATASIVAWE